MMDVLEERWDAKASVLLGKSRVTGGDAMELRVTVGAAGRIWRARGIKLSAADTRAGAVAGIEQVDGLLRAKIQCPVSRDVKWEIEFERVP